MRVRALVPCQYRSTFYPAEAEFDYEGPMTPGVIIPAPEQGPAPVSAPRGALEQLEQVGAARQLSMALPASVASEGSLDDLL